MRYVRFIRKKYLFVFLIIICGDVNVFKCVKNDVYFIKKNFFVEIYLLILCVKYLFYLLKCNYGVFVFFLLKII